MSVLIAQTLNTIHGVMDFNLLNVLDLIGESLRISPLFGIAILLIAVVMMVSLCMVVHKAEEPWWSQLVPVYNLYVLAKITFGNGWFALYVLLAIIPVVGAGLVSLIALYQMYLLAKAFGLGLLSTIGLIILPFVFLPFMAFSSSVEYCGAPSGFGR